MHDRLATTAHGSMLKLSEQPPLVVPERRTGRARAAPADFVASEGQSDILVNLGPYLRRSRGRLQHGAATAHDHALHAADAAIWRRDGASDAVDAADLFGSELLSVVDAMQAKLDDLRDDVHSLRFCDFAASTDDDRGPPKRAA